MFQFVKAVILGLGLNFAASVQAEMSLEGEAANEVMDFVSSRLGTQQQTIIEDQVKQISVKGEDFSAFCVIWGPGSLGCNFSGPIERSITGTRVSVKMSKPVSDDIIKQLDVLGVPSFRAAEYVQKHFRFNIDCFKSIDVTSNETTATQCQIDVIKYYTSAIDFTGVTIP